MAAFKIRGATSLTGGGSGALDAIDGAKLVDGDGAMAFTGSTLHFYSLDADSAAVEDSPRIIKPDTNAGDKRWINIYTMEVSQANRDVFTATENQTVFDLSFTYALNSNHVLVVKNGAILPTTEYTETSTTRITLSSGCVAGDEVEVLSVNTVALANLTTAVISASAAQTAAETAQTAAETAETNAETAQTSAELAQAAAEAAAENNQPKVSSNDTTPGYLEDKIVGGTGITVTTLNDGGDEDVNIAADSASLTAAGIVEFATGTETATGDDDTRAVTPDGLAEFIQYETIWIGAAAMAPTTTNGAEVVSNEYATNDIMADALAFDGATEEFADFNFPMPENWDRGTIKAKVFWAPGDAAATAGDTVEWELQGGALSDDGAIDRALGTAQVISDTVLAGVAADLHITSATPSITVGGSPALGNWINFKLSRNVGGTDDMTEDAWLFGIWIQYKRTNTVTGW